MCLFVALSASCSARTAPIEETIILPSGPLTASQLSGIPEQWHAYLQAAREADRIVDPMARCLAFPDLPGTHWPREQTAAHCRAHHAPHLSPDEALRRVTSGKFESLAEELRGYEKAHQDPADRSEAIHLFYGTLAASPEGDRTTSLWLRAQPDSPYALTARAAYLVAAAQDARGPGYIADTPPEAIDRMRVLLAEAQPLYEKAIAISPSGLHAHLLAYHAAMLSGARERMNLEFGKVREIDPGCEVLASARMMSLRPRWGGSYPEMEAYADTVRAQIPSRPRLAQQLIEPLVDRADVLLCDRPECAGARAKAESMLREALAQASDEDAMRDLAWVLEKAGLTGPERYEAYVLTLQRSRFVPEDLAYDSLAVRLPNDLAWRLQYAERAFRADPDDGKVRARTGDLYFRSGRPSLAEERLGGCINDVRFGSQCLQSLVWGWLSTTSLPPAERSARASHWLDLAQAREPDNSLLWLYRAVQAAYAGDVDGERRAFARYDALPGADQHDSVNRRAAFVRMIDDARDLPGEERQPPH